MSSTKMKFDSEGFDLDAAISNVHLSSSSDITTNVKEKDGNNNNNNNNEVIYEIGGATTNTTTTTTTTTTIGTETSTSTTTTDETTMLLKKAEALKEEGNEAYKNQDYNIAYDKYTLAIRTIEESCDLLQDDDDDVDEAKSLSSITKQKIMSGLDILKKKDIWEQEQHLRLRNELRQRDSNPNNTTTTTTTNATDSQQQPEQQCFVLDPPHPYGTVLATYYCNRAAALMQIAALSSSSSSSSTPSFTTTSKTTTTTTSSWYDQQHDDDESITSKMKHVHIKDQDAVQDCTIAILLNPKYSKAYIRRATIYEQRYHPYTLNHTELALNDMRMVQQLEPNNRTVQNHIQRLERIEQQRMDQLKEETMSKLKDLGNSILGNFGLSLDNFKTQQDPNTGSYNISFSQN